jgi:hypothetical protein
MPRPQSAHFGYPILSSVGQKSTEMRRGIVWPMTGRWQSACRRKAVPHKTRLLGLVRLAWVANTPFSVLQHTFTLWPKL